ncbi:MAG: outer membrane beta-barrel protein [Nitratireductor sp.]
MREKTGVPHLRGTATGILAVLLCTGVSTVSVFAQESELRGEVSAETVNRSLLSSGGIRPGEELRPAESNTARQTYVPVSEGALPDETEDGENTTGRERSIFADSEDDDDPFADAPRPAGRPSMARQNRRQAERDSATERTRGRSPTTTAEDGDDAQIADIVETTASVRAPTLDSLDEDANSSAEILNGRLEAIETRDLDAEEAPYAPLGLRLGTFDVTATLDQGVRWTSNVDSSPGGEEGWLSETQLRLNAVSDWSRHAARASLYGTFLKSVSGADYSQAQGGLDTALDFDLGGGYAASAGFAYTLRPETASSPVVIVGTASQPLQHGLTGTLGLRKDIGKLRLSATGLVDREIYSDAELSGGGTLSQEERNATLASLALRVGYEISPAIVPFVETEIGRRFYDLEIDTSGFARSADRLAVRGGATFDFGEKLSGELSAGWLRETFDDTRLIPVSGPAVDARLAWSPVRGTTVTLTGSTTVEGTTSAGESGSILYSGGLALSREARANLLLEASIGADWRDYVGTSDNERALRAEAGATWWFNRYVGLNGRLRHETFKSTLPNRDWQASSVYLGLRLQR